jgi:hypothetical protein
VGDACIGVPTEPLCASDPCTVGPCSQIVSVSNDGELAQAIASTSAGDCIALSQGSYSGFSLADGVSAFGRGAGLVTVKGDVTSGGNGSRLRGLLVSGGSIIVASGDTLIDAVRVYASTGDGVQAATATSVVVTNSEVSSTDRYGTVAFGAAALALYNSKLSGSAGPGVWAQCDVGDPCACAQAMPVHLENVLVDGNALVGVSLVGVSATLENVIVSNTKVGPNFQAGGGMSISGCSDVTAGGITIEDNVDFGLLVDDSSIDVDGIEVRGNLRGVWIQKIGQSLAGGATLRNGVIADNKGVGFGIGTLSLGVLAEGLEVLDTQSIALPVLVGGVSAGSQQVGDGLTWLDGAQVTLSNLTMSGSARASVLIDKASGAGSSIEGIVLAGGDEAKGIVLQSYAGGTQPTLAGGAPALDVQVTEVFSVPNEVAIPPGI